MTTTLTAPTAAPEAPGTDPRTAAGWAGAGYLALFVLAIFANFLALGSVLHPDDAGATAAALAAHETTFRVGTVAFLAIFLIDVVIAWALLVLFRGVQRDLALLAAWFRLGYTVMLGVSLVFLYVALELIGTDAAEPTLLALRAFDFTWVAGLAAFGLHLVLIGRLLLTARTSGRGTRAIGWLLVVAGAAYVVDTVAHVALADYERYADAFLAMVALPSMVGELSLAVWLLLVATGRQPVPARRV
ncbi:DUF4386 domain-containing protein [Nocardioides sp. GY 10113]|uniref:DUF4386 domain-containing protein n=1 Tax=Nocardioides sp. GY 10113 TaxID=2569761 RepID=UPI0010A8286C|nr:DUF4386 domain-containing protein [Nocardioides sp. GY 10113]TIC88268.1 DUF4386 domain-containing protein [Nocardioides sp. GY 10113]